MTNNNNVSGLSLQPNTIQCTYCGLFIKWDGIGKTAGQYRLDPMARCDETWYPNHYIQMTLERIANPDAEVQACR